MKKFVLVITSLFVYSLCLAGVLDNDYKNLIGKLDVADEVYSYTYTKFDHYTVEKMVFAKVRNEAGKLVADKSRIIFNGNITIGNIPAKAYEYIVNGKSAIEWIIERYQITIDKASQIKNGPNDWSREHDNPTYIFDLLLSIINLSVQRVDIVNNLPKLNL